MKAEIAQVGGPFFRYLTTSPVKFDVGHCDAPSLGDLGLPEQGATTSSLAEMGRKIFSLSTDLR
jgi:hypothetical protein